MNMGACAILKKHESSEADHQYGFLIWFKNKFPDVLIYHCPNGEKRSIKTAVRLKKMGVVAGIPDLFVPSWMLYIELKREKGGVVSPAQKEIMSYLERVGYTCLVCHGATDASRKVLEFLEERNK
jgi:hypothetical protein